MIKRQTLFDTFRTATMNNPNGTHKDQFDAFLESVRANDYLVTALARDYFDRMAANWQPKDVGGSTILAGTPVKEHREEMRAERRKETERAVSKRLAEIKAAARVVLTLDFVLPIGDGKMLKNCTFAEVGELGGIFAEIAKCGKGNQVVGRHMNAKELENVVSRFDKPRRRAATATAHTESRVSA